MPRPLSPGAHHASLCHGGHIAMVGHLEVDYLLPCFTPTTANPLKIAHPCQTTRARASGSLRRTRRVANLECMTDVEPPREAPVLLWCASCPGGTTQASGPWYDAVQYNQAWLVLGIHVSPLNWVLGWVSSSASINDMEEMLTIAISSADSSAHRVLSLLRGRPTSFL